ncbi:MAG: hypothetical protein RR550_01980 [Rikenellaceae bacterium]
MGYNEFIFSSLAARKSILIEGIGVISVVACGSRNCSPKSACEFPHYELRISDSSAYDVSLRDSVSGEYQKWLIAVKCTRKKRSILIDGCFTLQMDGEAYVSVSPCASLLPYLYPFSLPKKKRSFPYLIVLSSVVILLGLGYSGFELLTGDFFTPPPAPKIAVSAPPVAPAPVVMPDTVVVADTLVRDSIVTPSPRVSVDGYTEQMHGNSYLVVGSFSTLAESRSDARRLERLYPDLTISTSKKMRGDYFNYIYTSTSFEEVDKKKVELYDKYDKIKGMWVYRMR